MHWILHGIATGAQCEKKDVQKRTGKEKRIWIWYLGWKAYAEGQNAPKGSCVYLSLGRKEEKTRNRKMAVVGDMTRWQYERTQKDLNVHTSELIWHNGGHFTDMEKRIAQGFIWLIEHERK